jgi:hypothetical protein
MLAMICLGACVGAPPQATVGVVDIFATSAAYPWLAAAFDCGPPSTRLRVSTPDVAEITLRLGAPDGLALPAFQIGLDDLLVVVQPQAGVGTLSSDEAIAIFSGEITNWKDLGGSDLAVQVWTFSPTEDVQLVFDRAVMHGRPVSSRARLAVTAQAMSDSVGAVSGSVGLLPRRWKTGNTREALVVSSVPVLAIVRADPQGSVRQLIGCLQSGH